MIRLLIIYPFIVLASVRALFRSRGEQAIVELALRHQLDAYSQKRSRPTSTPLHRAFWVALSRIWSGWRETLVIVQPETVVRWHRAGFRLYWRSISKPGPGRPGISPALQAHVIVIDEQHPRRLLCEYVEYYSEVRVHTCLRDSPDGRTSENQPSPNTKIVALPRVGGLRHRYTWRNAA